MSNVACSTATSWIQPSLASLTGLATAFRWWKDWLGEKWHGPKRLWSLSAPGRCYGEACSCPAASSSAPWWDVRCFSSLWGEDPHYGNAKWRNVSSPWRGLACWANMGLCFWLELINCCPSEPAGSCCAPCPSQAACMRKATCSSL